MKKTTNHLLGTMIVILSLSFISLAQNRTDLSSTHSWKQYKSIPIAMSPKTTMIGEKIYLWGSSLYEYDVKRDYWKEKPGASIPRYDFPIVSFNGKIYVIGGRTDSSKTPTSLVEEYDPVKDKWQVKSPMPTARYAMGICVYKDKIYVFGGFVRRHVRTNIIEMYDPETDKWTRKSSLPQQMVYNSPIIINNTMYMSYENGFYKYNPELDKWTDTTSSHKLNNSRNMVPILVNDKMYAICLTSTNRQDGISHLVKYDPVTDSWEHLKDLPHFRMDYSIEALKGKIYVFGGWSEDYRKALNTCEMYDIETDTWKALPNMSVPKVGMGIQTFNNSIFLFGGVNGWDDANKIVYYSNVEALVTSQGSIKKTEILLPDSKANITSSQKKHPYASNQPMHEPKRFEIPVVNSAWHIAFEPDGNTFYFVTSGNHMEVIYYSHFEEGKWSKPKLTSFSGKYRIETPSISPDGKKFFFSKDISTTNWDIYVMDKTDTGWSEPRDIGSPINSPGFEAYPSSAANGNLYFISTYEGVSKIYCSKYLNGKYSAPKALDDIINKYSPGDLFISPDESYILFGVNDFYISFNDNGTWTKPQNLGLRISASQGRPCISPDGNYFFFTSGPGPDQYQVDIKPLVDSLRSTLEVNAMVEQKDDLKVQTLITLKERAGKIKFSKTPSWLKPYVITSGDEQIISNKINLNGLKAGTYKAQVSATAGKNPDKEYSYSVVLNLFEPVHAVTINNLQKGVRYEYYEDSSFTNIPDFTKMKPQKTGITKTIDLSVKNRDTFFAVAYNGYINIPQTAIYTFYLTSDDGSKLYIDDKLFINNDGLHAPLMKLENCCLEKGFHKIKVEFMQGSQGYNLELSYESTEAGIKRKAFSENELFY